MINIVKGTAHSLQQSDLRGGAITGVLAGMIAHVAANGNVAVGGDSTTGLRGFAINNSGDGDVIESNVIALYSLDGNSILETDQTDSNDGALTAYTFPVGTPMYASQVVPGKVTKFANTLNTAGTPSGTASTGANITSNGPVIGWVSGIRSLQNATPYPSGTSSSQNYTSSTETAAINAANAAGNTNFPTYANSTKSATYKAQVNVPVLGIKLAATA